MSAIFKDDSTAEDRRALAIERLMRMCPAAYRVTLRPFVEMAMAKATDAEISSLLVDIDILPKLAESGDADAITSLARKYGATDEQVATYMPFLTTAQ